VEPHFSACPGIILHVILDDLTSAKAFADLVDWRKISVMGRDALEWLDSLLTAPVATLAPGRAQRCLLLNDAGGLLADVTVAVQGSSVVVLQDPAQPRSIEDLLSVQTEGADVELEDRSRKLSIFAFPSRPASPDLGGTAHYAPSALGPGSDLVCLPEDHDRLRASLAKAFTLASNDDLEAWRIAAGRPRMGIDAFEGDLPQEAGLTEAVDLGKFSFLGRAAVAGIDETTPLRTVVVFLSTAEPVSPGEKVLVAGQPAGELTSVSATDSGVVALARVSWEQRFGPFLTELGVELRVPSPA
jgi:glycine cleavage system aminomethyltransferase T